MKKQKSLRQLARELGVSHSYLSQVLHGKRPASEKVQQAIDMVSMVSNNEARVGTSTPSWGIKSVLGGFDSHPLPPFATSKLVHHQYGGLSSFHQGVPARPGHTCDWY